MKIKIFILFFIIMLVAITGTYYYTTLRLWQMIPSGNLLRPTLLVFVAVAFVAFFVSMIFNESLPVKLTSFLYRFGTSWLFIAFYLLIAFALLDLIKATKLLPMEQFMRESWLGLAALTTVITAVMVYGNINFHNKLRVDLPIVVDKPMSENSIKAVFISDLHLGYNIGKREFEKWIEMINNENPDIVLIGGDIIDNSVKPLYAEDLADSFKKIKSTYGVYTCLGNHEYISNLGKSIKFLESTGINVLRDSVALIDNKFYVVGRDDLSGRNRLPLEELTRNLDHSKPIIVLDHQPLNLKESEDANVDLQLSGHTHRGQIFPATLVTDLIFEVSHGHAKKGDTHYYVSMGIGGWGGKFRIGSRSDYAVIEISGNDD